MAIAITPQAPEFNDVDMTYTIPVTTGVTYMTMDGYQAIAAGVYPSVNRFYTIYAQFDSGYEAAPGAVTIWDHTFPLDVVPAGVVFSHLSYSYRIDPTTGVEYYVNEEVTPTPADTYNGASGIVYVEAKPLDGYRIADGAVYQWIHDYESVSGNVQVEPYFPIFNEEEQTFTIPLMRGVSYKVEGEPFNKPSGLYTGVGDITIVAGFEVGYELAEGATGSWSYSFNPAPVTVVPATPGHSDQAGTFNDRFTIPVSEGVQYRVNGLVYPAGIYAGQQSVTIVAEPLSGYAVEESSQSQWSFTFSRTAVEPEVTGFSFYSFNTKTGYVTGRVPLTIEGDMTHLMQDFGTASFSINDTNRPANWRSQIQQHERSIAVQDDATGKIVWAGTINSFTNGASSGTSFSCLSFETYLATRYVRDIDFAERDQATWVNYLVGEFEANGAGFGLIADTPFTGVPRNLGFKAYDNKSYFSVLNELSAMENGFEWTLDVEWADENKNRVKRILRTGYPTIGNKTLTPNLAFNFPGNVIDYEYSEPRSQDNFATHVTVLGEGSGIKQVRSNPEIDEAKEVNIPRIEVLKNVSALKYTSDANAFAKGYAVGYSNPLSAIKLTISGEYAKAYRNMKKGDSARLTMITDDTPPVDEVWRVVAISTAADGTPSPTLARMEDGSKKFPRIPGDLTNLAREIRDVKTETNTATNPLSQGFPLFGEDGSGLDFGADGSITAFDSFGNSTPFFDPSTGSLGMGVFGDAIPQGYFYHGVIAVPPASKLDDLELNLEGSAELVTAANWTDNQQLLSRGDTVRVSKRASDGTYVVTGVIRAKTNVYTRNHRLFIDKFDIAGFGVNSYLHEKAEGGFRVYQPNKEVLEIPAPSIGTYEHMVVYGNNIYAWMTDGPWQEDDSRKRLFRFLKGSLFWEEIGYLPAVEASRYLNTFINETFSRPTIVTINRSSLSHPGGVAPMGFLLEVGPLGSPGQPIDFTSYALTTAPITEDAAGFLPSVSVIVNDSHMFVEVSQRKLYHVNLDTEVVTEMTEPTMFQYLGAKPEGDYTGWSQTVAIHNRLRLASNGDLYRGFVQSDGVAFAAVYERKFGSASPTVHRVPTADEVIVGRLYSQRDKNSSTFYVSGRIEVDVDGGGVEMREAMWKVVAGSSVAILKPGAGPAAASYSPSDSTSAIPLQHPDGTITAVVDLSISAGQQWGLELRTFASEFG